MRHIPGVNDIAGLRTACTQNVYDTLLKDYCALGVNPKVQRGVLTFNSDNGVSSSGCGSMGCEYVSCPVNTADILKSGEVRVGSVSTFIDLLTGNTKDGTADSTSDISATVKTNSSRSCHTSGGFRKRTTCSTYTYYNLIVQQNGGGTVAALSPSKPFEYVTKEECSASLTRSGTANALSYSVTSSPNSVVLCVQAKDGTVAAVGKLSTSSVEFKTWKK